MRYVIIDGRGIIPDRVTKIDNSAFYGCSRLESIVIPDSVTLIEEAAFADCEYLQSIVIPDSVTKIEAWAFSSCYSLQSITIVTQEKDPDLSREMIEHLLQALSEYPKEIYLKIPIGCEDAYRHHPAFKGKFVEIISDKQILKNAKKCVRKPNI
jgi:cell surface protein